MLSFTLPQVFPNLYECLCSAEYKGRYSEECGKQSSSGAPLTIVVFIFLLWKSMVPQNSLLTNFLQNIFLCVQQNKYIHIGLELISKWWHNFHFGVNYPFKIVFLNTKHMHWNCCVLCYINYRCSVCLPWCRWHQTLLWWGSGALLRISGVFHICLGAHGPHRYPILPLWLGGLWQVCAVCGLQPGLVYSILGSVEEMQLYVSVRVGNSEPEKSVWRTESWIPRSSRI